MSGDAKTPDYLAALAAAPAANRNYARLVILNGEEVGDGAQPGGGGDGEDASERAWCSDDMLADELSKSQGENARCASETGDWYIWNGARWELDRRRAIYRRSRQVCRGVSQKVDNAKLQRDVSSKTRIYAAVKLAGEDARHVVLLEEFDQDDRLINTPSGIVDLTTGQLRLHDRAAMMTRITAAAPEGDCPKFHAYLREATGGDVDLERFLQRIAGYCLTGLIEEHAIFFLYGPGGTGKSVFLLVLYELLQDATSAGGYAAKAEMDIFTVATGERHTAPIASLNGARLVIASETEEGKRWDEAKLKAITGGDPITANFMRGNPFTFRPRFKLLIAGNHRPRLRSADDAMRRRLHVIPFMVKPARANKALLGELRAERGGILRWAIEGELERQRTGLAPPRVVVEATDEYFEAENVIGRWVEERCDKDPTSKAFIKDLYANYKSWAAGAGESVLAERTFGQKISLIAGVERWKDWQGKRGFKGLSLKGAQPDLLSSGAPVARGEGGDRGEVEPPRQAIDPEDEFDR